MESQDSTATGYSSAQSVTTGDLFDETNKKMVANLSALEEELNLLLKVPEDKRTRKQSRRIENLQASMKAVGKQVLPKANWGGKSRRMKGKGKRRVTRRVKSKRL